MRKRTSLIVCAAVLIAPVLPLQAKPPVPVDPAIIEAYFTAFHTCVVKQAPAQAQAWVLAPLAGQHIPDKLEVEAWRCIGKMHRQVERIELASYIFRGGLAKIMFLQNAPPAPVETLRVSAKADTPHPDDLLTDAFGGCVAAADPENARAFIATISRSPAERALAATLRPSFDACVQEGSNLEINGDRLRAALAVALYRAANPQTVTLQAAAQPG